MRVIAGPEKKSRLFSEKERKITAYHEMGHALVGYYLEGTDDVHKISIVSRGQALGYTISLPSEDRYLTTKGTLMDQMAMTLGGRAAEELVFHEVTTGAANDLEKVTHTAKQMIMRFGMSEKLGPRVLGRDHDMPFLGRDMGSAPGLLGGDRTRDRRRDPPRDRGGARHGDPRAARAHGRAAQPLADPDRARDGRQGSVRAAARRRGRRHGLPGGGHARRAACVDEAPEKKPALRPSPRTIPGAAMQPPPEGAAGCSGPYGSSRPRLGLARACRRARRARAGRPPLAAAATPTASIARPPVRKRSTTMSTALRLRAPASDQRSVDPRDPPRRPRRPPRSRPSGSRARGSRARRPRAGARRRRRRARRAAGRRSRGSPRTRPRGARAPRRAAPVGRARRRDDRDDRGDAERRNGAGRVGAGHERSQRRALPRAQPSRHRARAPGSARELGR